MIKRLTLSSAFRINRPEGGFTLVEMAILLVVIGLLVGLGAGIVEVLSKNAKRMQTREAVEGAAESVISYASANDRLPPDQAAFNGIVRSSSDAFGKTLYYLPASNLTSLSTSVCGRKTTALSLRDCTTETCIDIINVAFIVVSGAEDYNMQTSLTPPIVIYAQGTTNTDDYSADMNRPEPYNDIAKYVTLFELKSKIKCD